MATMIRYTSVDGDRQVVLTVTPGAARPFALTDAPVRDGAPGVHFLLDAHPTLAAAERAAAQHARLASEVGTYEARAVRVGLCTEEDIR